MGNPTGGGNGSGIIIDASGLFAKIQALQKGAQAAPYLRAIGFRLMGWVDQQFRTDGNAPGSRTPWKPLSPNTVAGRRRGSNRPLQDTGRLKQSWGPAAGNPHVIGDHTVQVSSNLKYTPYHEFGTGPYVIRPRRPGGVLAFMTAGGKRFARFVNHPGLPARPMSPPVDVAKKLAIDTLNAAIQKMLRQAGANR